MEFGKATFLDSLLEFFQEHCILGYQALAPHAFELIMVLAVIDICITWTLYSGELRMSEIISRVMKISFFMFFILNFDKINQAILLSFQYAGLTAAGQPIDGALLKPSGIIDKGFEACRAILEWDNRQSAEQSRSERQPLHWPLCPSQAALLRRLPARARWQRRQDRP